jgi:hypothetical protein
MCPGRSSLPEYGAVGLNERRTNRDGKERYQNEYNQGRHHLNGGFGSLLFRSLTAGGAQRVRVNP